MQIPDTRELKTVVTDALEGSASSLREAAKTGGGPLGDFARQAACGIGTVTGYLQQNDWQDMLEDAERYVRQNPERSLVAAAAVGLLLGAVVRRR